jgi:hypothetical protein
VNVSKSRLTPASLATLLARTHFCSAVSDSNMTDDRECGTNIFRLSSTLTGSRHAMRASGRWLARRICAWILALRAIRLPLRYVGEDFRCASESKHRFVDLGVVNRERGQ